MGQSNILIIFIVLVIIVILGNAWFNIVESIFEKIKSFFTHNKKPENGIRLIIKKIKTNKRQPHICGCLLTIRKLIDYHFINFAASFSNAGNEFIIVS